jgi:hypothetical protein
MTLDGAQTSNGRRKLPKGGSLAAVGAISALIAKFTIVVVRSERKPSKAGSPTA